MKVIIYFSLIFALTSTSVFAKSIRETIKDPKKQLKCCKKVINEEQNQCDYRKVMGICSDPYIETAMIVCNQFGIGEKPCESTMSGGTLNLNPHLNP
jgi:uncharacterized protein YcfJ